MEGLASEAAEPKTEMIDATDLKAHRTASARTSLSWFAGKPLRGNGTSAESHPHRT
jgi:hypothetical protein